MGTSPSPVRVVREVREAVGGGAIASLRFAKKVPKCSLILIKCRHPGGPLMHLRGAKISLAQLKAQKEMQTCYSNTTMAE